VEYHFVVVASPPTSFEAEPLRRRAFAFYPAIVNVEYNEWRFRKATWSEILVTNTKSGVEVWIPRRLIGEVSSVDEPVMIVNLLKELEYKAGAVWPHERRVLEMPRTAEGISINEQPVEPAQQERVARIRPPATPESRVGRLIAAVLGGSLLVCLLGVIVLRLGALRPVEFTSVDQDFLSLTHNDDYYAVVRKLGAPARDRWRAETGELQYRALWYPQRSYHVILMGSSRAEARYIGAMDDNWRVIHYVELAGGGDTASILRSLPRF
jgi:hypothetical protein